MRITKQEIKNNEISARKYLEDYNLGQELAFDHFGLQALTTDEYLELKEFFIIRAKFEGEIHFHERRLGKFYLGDKKDKMELIEPHPGQVFVQYDCFVEHVAFKVKYIDRLRDILKDRIITDFNIEGAKGFKVQGPGALLIEFRNNEF
ncbi:MAG: hypothetical protein WCP14_02955 [bacterium]